MANLGSQKIGSNYQKLLQKDDNGMVADGSGSLITLNLSGSEYYLSSSVDVLKALTVTGSIVPEGDAKWDLGSNINPFRHLFVANESIVFIDGGEGALSVDREIKLTKRDVTDWLGGNFQRKIDTTTNKRLAIPIATSIKNIITEPFELNRFRNLYPVDLASNDTVQDTYWANDDDNLYLKPTRFGTVGVDTDDLEIV